MTDISLVLSAEVLKALMHGHVVSVPLKDEGLRVNLQASDEVVDRFNKTRQMLLLFASEGEGGTH